MVQGPHCKHGEFGPVMVGACEGQAGLHMGEELAQGSGSLSQTRCFWPVQMGACGGWA